MTDELQLPDEAPVSLYIDLEDGQHADLEIIGRAVIAFASAIRETGYVLDPSMTVRVELMSGTEGSISLNALIRSVRSSDFITKKRLIALATTAALWFTHETGRWTFDEVLHFLTGTHFVEHLSQDDVNDIANRVAEIVEKGPAQNRVGQVYRELDTDDAVRGVGATTRVGEKPARIVPRSEFRRRSGSATGVVEVSEIIRQTRRTHERVTLIRPVLEEGRGSWQFSGSAGRFFARIGDKRFQEDLLHGRIVVPMVAGIELDVDLDTTEEKRDNVWVVIGHTIVFVRRVYQPIVQGTLSLPPPEPRENESGNDPHDDRRR